MFLIYKNNTKVTISWWYGKSNLVNQIFFGRYETSKTNMNPISDKSKHESYNKTNRSCLFSNLPPAEHSEFIGRETELEKLLKHISPDYRQHITVVDGIGGIGKTSLVLKAANLCQNPSQKPKYLSNITIPQFEAIIFVSIKKSYLDFSGKIRQVYKESTLQHIFKVISSTLKNSNNINQTLGQEQIKTVYQCLDQQATLLIIDNLEAVKGTEKENILRFLSDLPTKVQAVITTREKVVFYSPISLDCLPEEEALKLIQQQAKEKEIILEPQDLLDIYNLSGGVPLAILYVVGYKKFSQKINLSLFLKYLLLFDNCLNIPNETIYLILKRVKESLNDVPDYQLLISISFFPYGSSVEAISQVADCDINNIEISQALEKLEMLSLIKKQEKKYLMHPITRKYVAQDLAQHHDFEKDARVRWVQWYLDFSRKYGGKDWKNWRSKYSQLKMEWHNLLSVLEWCAGNGHYEKVKALWNNLNQFANLEGYWCDRIFWLNWLIEESKNRAEWKTASYFMSEKGFTLIQMRELSKAKDLLEEAFDLEETFGLSNDGDLENQTLLCQHLALLHIYQKEYQDARSWLDKEKYCVEELAEKLKNRANIKSKEPKKLKVIERRKIAINTLEAEILLNKENYKKAEIKYQQIVNNSDQIGWDRRKNQAQDRISFIRQQLPSNKFSPISQSPKNLNRNILRKKFNKSNSYLNLYG